MDAQQENDEESVEKARLKLDEILKELADQEQSFEDDGRITQEVSGDGSISMPPPLTPSKRAGRTPRKRKKKETPPEPDFGDTSRPSFSVTLFDRSVDLAQFSEDRPLYVMCRAWMFNKPYARYPSAEKPMDVRESLQSPPSSQAGDDDIIVSLPDPIKSESAWTIPRPLPPACKTARLEDVVDTNDDMVELKRENTQRWRRVKQRWREASRVKQERYLSSLVVLKKLFSPP